MLINMGDISCAIASRSRPTTLVRPISAPVREEGPLGYLVSTPKALRILFTHKIRDTRFQHLLTQYACLLSALMAAGVGAFLLLPALWAVSAFAPGLLLFGLFISIGAGDLFLQFALEDEQFFEMATKSNALNVFADKDQSLPQPAL
jgi:hypothetical protein